MSRYDSVGMFWEDTGGSGILPTYDTSWKPVKEFPNLSGVKVLGIDTETFDPALLECGPGWGRGVGHIVGASLATEDGHSWYFPMRHKVQKELNMDPDKVLAFLRDVLKQPCVKVGANLQYDVGWLNQEGVQVNGPLYDVQFAEALIDDVARSYALEALAQSYVGEGKESNDLYEWARKAYGGKADSSQRKNIYRCPPSLVGPYAESDAKLPIEILLQQWDILGRMGLSDLFKLECDLIPVLIGMRMRGMNIDPDKVDFAKIAVQQKVDTLQRRLNEFAGHKVGVNSPADIARMFDKHDQEYPKTAKGNPSFVKDWLKHNMYEGSQYIYDIRRYSKVVGTFLQGAILDKAINNKVYPSLHPLRGDDGGAVSGRFSSSKPNGQQIPSRDEELAPIVRGCFIPDEGMSWLKADYSQIEYRFFAHFSDDKALIDAYIDPTIDFHALVGEMIGYHGHRTPIKSLNFGLLYGMGNAKLKKQLAAMDMDTDPDIFIEAYHEKFPAARKLIKECSDFAAQTGEIRTVLNRRNSFMLWEPMGGGRPLQYKQAIREYGPGIQRFATYKALNRKLQGSAADLMKKAMVDAYKEGIFDKIGFPHITVHDELDFSYHEDLAPEFMRLKEVMETAIPLKVPVMVDYEYGSNWGNVK